MPKKTYTAKTLYLSKKTLTELKKALSKAPCGGGRREAQDEIVRLGIAAYKEARK